MTNAWLLRADGLELAYGAKRVLHGVRLELRQGEFWFFLGPNGAGKTTLARAMLGLLEPRAGSLLKHPELTPDRIGFVPQQCRFNPTLRTTVREFTSLGMVGLGLRRPEQARRLDWALDRVGLLDKRGHDFWDLSGGQRQRVLIARALVRRPTLLIADEPVSGLDLHAQHGLLTTLAELNRAHETAIVFIAHDLALASSYSSHVALFRDGHVWSGAAAAMLTPEQLHRSLGLPCELCHAALGRHAEASGTRAVAEIV
jgi:ABC-type Mn2+/Zn2+ transport system ATPase subunit